MTLLLALGVFAGAVVSGFCGFAFSAVAGAVLLHVLAPAEAIPLMMVCSVLVQGASLVFLRQSIEWGKALPFIAGGLAGLPPALYFLMHGQPAAIRVSFGAFLTAYAAYMLFRPRGRFFAQFFNRAAGPAGDMAAGFVGGLLGGVTAMPGAIPAIWCDLRGIGKEQQRAMVQPYITAMQVASLALLAVRSELPPALPAYVFYSAAPLAGGAILGLALFGRVSDAAFRRALLCVLLASGLSYLL